MKNQNRTRLIVFLIVLLGIGVALYYRQQLAAANFEHWVKSAGSAGPLVFMLLYILATVFFLPGSILTLAGGALFGPYLGVAYNIISATIGASIAFMTGRYLAAEWVEKRLGQNTDGRMQKLMRGVDNEGWRFIAFVRLVPLFPFNALNYALGLTRIPMGQYVLTSFICMLPGTAAYTYLGYVAREAVAGQGDVQHVIRIGVIAIALLTVVAYLPRVIRKFRNTDID